MRALSMLAIAAATLTMASLSTTTSAVAADGVRSGKYKYTGKYRAKIRRDPYDSYYARANNLDPAGDYKGYPDWARVALSPKSDGFKR